MCKQNRSHCSHFMYFVHKHTHNTLTHIFYRPRPLTIFSWYVWYSVESGKVFFSLTLWTVQISVKTGTFHILTRERERYVSIVTSLVNVDNEDMPFSRSTALVHKFSFIHSFTFGCYYNDMKKIRKGTWHIATYIRRLCVCVRV